MSLQTQAAVLVFTLASLGCGHPRPVALAPTATCLTDERGELWALHVREVEATHTDSSGIYLIRDALECRQALGLFYRALGSVPGSTPAYAIRLGNGGYVIIVPGALTGEWQDSYWLDKDGKLAPIILGL
jgi:hypothetical protein